MKVYFARFSGGTKGRIVGRVELININRPRRGRNKSEEALKEPPITNCCIDLGGGEAAVVFFPRLICYSPRKAINSDSDTYLFLGMLVDFTVVKGLGIFLTRISSLV